MTSLSPVVINPRHALSWRHPVHYRGRAYCRHGHQASQLHLDSTSAMPSLYIEVASIAKYGMLLI